MPFRSSTERIGVPSSSDMRQKGFFWYVLPMIFSGAPFNTDGTVAIGAERPTSALPEITISSAVVLPAPARSSTLPKPAFE